MVHGGWQPRPLLAPFLFRNSGNPDSQSQAVSTTVLLKRWAFYGNYSYFCIPEWKILLANIEDVMPFNCTNMKAGINEVLWQRERKLNGSMTWHIINNKKRNIIQVFTTFLWLQLLYKSPSAG